MQSRDAIDWTEYGDVIGRKLSIPGPKEKNGRAL